MCCTTEYRPNQAFNFEFQGKLYPPPGGSVEATPDGVHSWATTADGMAKLGALGRLQVSGSTLQYVLYHDDFPVTALNSVWNDTAAEFDKHYVVQTSEIPIERCMLMSTSPGDLVLDPTCGSGTTASVAERWGRRWITCDTSRVSITLAKQRLIESSYRYYQLEYPLQGIGSGMKYEKAAHITLGSVAQNEPSKIEILVDKPLIDSSRVRVTGPFTVEAVPAPMVKPLVELDGVPSPDEPRSDGDASIARGGETLRQCEWRDELLRAGIRGKNGQYILFSRVEPLAGTRWLHAEAETKPNDRGSNIVADPIAGYDQRDRVVISFGPEHAPLERKQVELAWDEARKLRPKPALLVFAAFQFDPEAAKDIDELPPEKAGMTLLKVQMNADLLTEDLKKKRSSNESFWLVGQPDVKLTKIKSGEHKGKYSVEVLGFDYYNTKTGGIESGGSEKIAMWLLDTDYDGRSLFPRQVFFPMAAEDEGWSKLARNLKAEIDEDLIEAYRGTVSLPFAAGEHGRVAVKIVDDRGIESLRILSC